MSTRFRLLPRHALSLAAAAVVVTVVAAPAAAGAAEQPVQLSAKPVGQPGQFFDLTLAPGQTQEFKVALGNHGAAPVAARTYVANVYTIINGGFGAALRGEATGPTAGWLRYPTQVLTLQPGRATVRDFSISVPPGTAPGEYITSVVLENDQPVKASGAVALDQVVRQAVAVAVRVPGPLQPGLTIRDASHKFVAQRSVIAVGVTNTGNMRLTPTARIVLHDAVGAIISRATVRMDSFYAGTDTSVEIPLAQDLEPGDYSVDLTLDDRQREAHAQALGLPLTVVAPPTIMDANRSAGRQLVDVLQTGPGWLPLWALMSVGVVAVTLVVLLVVLIVRGRRSRASSRGRRRIIPGSASGFTGPVTPAKGASIPQRPPTGHVLPTRGNTGRRRAAKHRSAHRVRA